MEESKGDSYQGTHKYQVIQREGQGFVFSKDGFDAFCYVTQPLISAGRLQGQAEITRLPCSSICPHAVLNKTAEGKGVYMVKCSGEISAYDVDVFEIPKPKSDILHLAD